MVLSNYTVATNARSVAHSLQLSSRRLWSVLGWVTARGDRALRTSVYIAVNVLNQSNYTDLTSSSLMVLMKQTLNDDSRC